MNMIQTYGSRYTDRGVDKCQSGRDQMKLHGWCVSDADWLSFKNYDDFGSVRTVTLQIMARFLPKVVYDLCFLHPEWKQENLIGITKLNIIYFSFIYEIPNNIFLILFLSCDDSFSFSLLDVIDLGDLGKLDCFMAARCVEGPYDIWYCRDGPKWQKVNYTRY